MRINKFVAQATGLSRRAADSAITDGRVKINGLPAALGQEVIADDTVTLDGKVISPAETTVTVMLNKPVGYVCSRNGQGSKTVYDLLPIELHHLKPVGRLDKDSSGLLLLTNDGALAYQLSHPRHQKAKVYVIELDKRLSPEDAAKIKAGVMLDDGVSTLKIEEETSRKYQITMTEGRNRQIRRTFSALGYEVIKLHRIRLGSYDLKNIPVGKWQKLT